VVIDGLHLMLLSGCEDRNCIFVSTFPNSNKGKVKHFDKNAKNLVNIICIFNRSLIIWVNELSSFVMTLQK
jgi:hypothetical protein